MLLPYLRTIAAEGIGRALADHPELRRAVYIQRGKVTRESLARAFGLPLAAVEG